MDPSNLFIKKFSCIKICSFLILVISIILYGCSDSDPIDPEPEVYEYAAVRSHCDPLIISIKANKKVTITTTGSVITNINGNVADCDIWTDANGIPGCHYINEIPELHDLPFMALIGMFDNEYFLVGTSYKHTFTSTGNLELSVNDWGGCNNDSDNDGTFIITVLIE